jgi:hypothetical protein
MTTSHRRIALLTGASISALGLAFPAHAAVVTNPAPPTQNAVTDDTLEICAIGDTCVYGVEAEDTGSVSATVNSNLTGEVQQYGVGTTAGIDLLAVNDGDATIHAVAVATGAGAQTANARVSTAISQTATGSGPVSLTIDNNGPLAIEALATATGDDASAIAYINTAIYQFGSSTGGDVSLAITNDSTLNVNIAAVANGVSVASASASGYGIYQDASAFAGGGDAAVAFTNNAAYAVAVTASANASQADAEASFSSGNWQFARADGGGNASVSLTNNSSIDIAVNAVANGTAGGASADAYVRGAVLQTVESFATGTGLGFSPGGNATASLANGTAGVINVAANATAVATGGGVAAASATVSSAINQIASADNGDATAIIVNDGSINISAIAAATGDVSAFALINGGIRQSAFASNPVATTGTTLSLAAVVTTTGPDAFITMTNNASIAMTASAAANDTGTGPATATAVVTSAIVQDASATAGNAGVNFANSGSITVAALANATAASGSAFAFASNHIDGAVVQQFANATAGSAGAVFSNSGTIAATASAVAAASGGFASAVASIGGGVLQSAVGSVATASAVNSGSITLNAVASASATTSASASAYAFGGLLQVVGGGSASAIASNSGTVALSASAVAAASGTANAIAQVASGVVNGAFSATTANLTLTNNGAVSLNAIASASGAGGAGTGGAASAFASASAATAVGQFAAFVSSVNATLSNAGTVSANASAVAIGNGTNVATGTTGTTLTGAAEASAFAYGMGQFVLFAGTANLIMNNDGVVNVSANATASGANQANATASATGLYQTIVASTGPSSLALTNSGQVSVAAHALATLATTGSASAFADANGYYGFVSGAADAAIVNAGTMSVNASATATSGTATALAAGLILEAADFVTGTGTLAAVNTGPVTGSIENSGTLNVGVFASGGTFTTLVGTGTTATTTTVALSSAVGTGIYVSSGINNLTITNSGSLNVDAVVANGGNAEAYGILVEGNGAVVAPAVTDVVTINNSGDLIVRESIDGGGSYRRGVAIDVTAAPNAAVINLLGGGNIYGNINIGADDVINVESGRTIFDGVVNDACLAENGGPGPVFNGLASSCGVGVVNVQNDGELFLADDPFRDDSMYDGPSYVFVNTFNVAADGTVVFQLPSLPTGGTQPIGSYPQIFADTVNLETGSTLLVAPNGLPADDYFFDNVIDGNVRNGQFSVCAFDGTYVDSALLGLECQYEDGNVDLAITRVLFDAVPGLNQNGTSVGAGLECIYDPTLTGGIQALLSDLFTFNAADYNVALNQLAGASYASYLQSFQSLGVHYNDLLDHATSCEIPALAGSSLECRTDTTHVWGQVDFQNRRVDGDSEIGRFDADRWSALMGVDFNVGPQAIIGASIGRVTNRLESNPFNDLVKAEGYQVGLYGVFDPGAFYFKGIGTYNRFDGDSRRRINFVPFGGTFAGTTNGDPDIVMWTLGAHMGYRMAMGQASVVTPYLNIDYVNAKLEGFTESGLEGADLTIRNSREKRTTGTLGVKYAADLGGIVPEANLAYRYQFGDRRSEFTACFVDDPACEFDIVSASEKRGSILAGLSIGGKAGPVDVRIGYEGLFNSDVRSHSGNFKIVLPFGGGAPLPPPPVMAPPPPPPPEPVVEAPAPVEAPPPPPPPPPAAGERGR